MWFRIIISRVYHFVTTYLVTFFPDQVIYIPCLLNNFGLQIWALAIGKKTEMLATGGSDAVINLWHDSTAADKEESFRKEVRHLSVWCFIF